MSSAYQVGCRLTRYQHLLQWFTCPPLGTIFSPADVLNNHILLSVCAFLNNNWNLWGDPQIRQICRLGDMILAVYVNQEAVIDLTADEEDEEDPQLPQVWNGEWIVLDEVMDEDMPDAEESEESEEEYDSHSESEYSTSESEDSGVEV
jgi:hypothetical protein